MTVGISMILNDSVIFASDSLVSKGTSEMWVGECSKIFKLGEYVGGIVWGAIDLAMSIVDEFNNENVSFDNYDGLIMKFSAFCRGRYKKIFNSPFKRKIFLGYLIGFYDSGGNREMYSIRSDFNFAPLRVSNGSEVVGVDKIARYLLAKHYKRDLSREQALVLAHYVVNENIKLLPLIGGPIQMSIIDCHGFRIVSNEMIDNIRAQADRMRKLAGDFLINEVKNEKKC